MTPQMRRALVRQLPPEYQDIPTGPYETFNVVSTQMAASGTTTPTVSFPVTAALFEISGAAVGGGTATAALGFLDGFTIQISTPDGTALNAGSSQLLGTAFFNYQRIHPFRKPWIIPPSTNLSIALTNVSGANLTVHLGFQVLLLSLQTNAAQF